MTCVICPTCGSQCSLGGVGETHYFIPQKDENERIADLERQLAAAKGRAEYWKAEHLAGNLVIEAMRPVVEFVDADSSDHCAPDGSVCLCDQCQLVRQYRKARKPK